MHLNRKGYLTVDVILASVVAVSIAIFLMEITIRLVNITDDTYVNTELIADKALIIKNIKEQLEKDIKNGGGIKSIELRYNDTWVIIDFCKNDDNTNEIYYDRNMYIYNNNLVYEEKSDDEELHYEKKLNSKYLSDYKFSSSKTGTVNNNEYILFQITADNKFSKEPFEADIIVYNNKTCD